MIMGSTLANPKASEEEDYQSGGDKRRLIDVEKNAWKSREGS